MLLLNLLYSSCVSVLPILSVNCSLAVEFDGRYVFERIQGVIKVLCTSLCLYRILCFTISCKIRRTLGKALHVQNGSLNCISLQYSNVSIVMCLLNIIISREPAFGRLLCSNASQ